MGEEPRVKRRVVQRPGVTGGGQQGGVKGEASKAAASLAQRGGSGETGRPALTLDGRGRCWGSNGERQI